MARASLLRLTLGLLLACQHLVSKSPRAQSEGPRRKNLICYYDGPGAAGRPAPGSLAVDSIDAFLCTHIIYRYARFADDNQLFASEPQLELDGDGGAPGTLSKLAHLKQLNPSLKTLVSVSEDSAAFSRMAASADARASFAAGALDFLEAHSLNGLELVWKYPNDWAGQAADKQNLVSLVRELRQVLAARGHLLALAAPVGDRRVRAGFEVARLAPELDLINLMSFDYNGAWDNETGLHAPLYQAAEGEAALSVDWSVKLWLSLGAPAHKLQVAVTAYARTFNLLDRNQNGLRKPTLGFAKPGPYVGDQRLLAYAEWCEMYQRAPKQWRVVRDVAGSGGSYAYSGQLWVSLEEPQSAALKGRYVVQAGLGGALVHSLDMDDFAGRCHDGLRFPVAAALRDSLQPVAPAGSASGRPADANRNTPAPASEEPDSSVEEGEYPRRPSSARPPPGPPIRPTTNDGSVVDQEQPPVPSPPPPPPPAVVSRPPVSRQPTPQPPTSSPQPDTQQHPSKPAPTCGANGNWYFPGPTCRQYYDCTDTGAPVLKLCRDKLVWKQSKLWCDFQENVPECVA